jgi:hypothetical protein
VDNTRIVQYPTTFFETDGLRHLRGVSSYNPLYPQSAKRTGESSPPIYRWEAWGKMDRQSVKRTAEFLAEHVTGIVLDFVLVQEFQEFFFEGSLAMMFLLFLNVFNSP